MTLSRAFSTAKSSRVLIIGATGFIGRFVADASLDSGRPTYVLVRSSVSSPSKAKITQQLQDKGAVILSVFSLTSLWYCFCRCFHMYLITHIYSYMKGSISDKEVIEELLKEHEIDIVISTVGGAYILNQLPLVEAIKAAGTVKVRNICEAWMKSWSSPFLGITKRGNARCRDFCHLSLGMMWTELTRWNQVSSCTKTSAKLGV